MDICGEEGTATIGSHALTMSDITVLRHSHYVKKRENSPSMIQLVEHTRSIARRMCSIIQLRGYRTCERGRIPEEVF